MDESSQTYNVRQYKLMLKMIQDYQNGDIKLGHLVANLDALRGVLQNPPEPWLSEVESLWGKLEDVYAIMLDEERTEFDDLDRKLIKESIIKLESLVKAQIENATRSHATDSHVVR